MSRGQGNQNGHEENYRGTAVVDRSESRFSDQKEGEAQAQFRLQ